MGDGFQFIDIVFFAMIAAFLILRLRNVLGRRDGHEGGHPDPFGGRPQAEPAEESLVRLPDRSASAEEAGPSAGAGSEVPLADGLIQIQVADPKFDGAEFVSGARLAFEMILSAFVEGNSAALKPLLSAEVFANFSGAIRDRERSGETLTQTLVAIKAADLVEAYMEGHIAQVTVKFVSEQINATRNRDGAVIEGDPAATIEVTDFWTFARDTQSRDPNWVLVGTRSLD